jgi:predicted thioesterase
MSLERTEEFTAEGRLLTDVRGTLPVKVLSTPGMIAMMERCASVLSIGIGTHERRVIDRSNFG